MPQKLAIFGAGDFGRHALAYYGEENVDCFLDNNQERIGTEYYGKPILSLSQYLERPNQLTIVIAMRFPDAVIAQLKNAGIHEGYICFRPAYQKFLEQIPAMASMWKDAEHFTFFGVEDFTTEKLIEQFAKQINARGRFVVVEDDGASTIGTVVGGCKVRSFRESEGFPRGVVILSSSERLQEREIVAEHFSRRKALVINPFQSARMIDDEDVVYNPYARQNHEADVTEREWIQDVKRDPNKAVIFRLVDVLQKYQPLFHHVEIETINRCNGKCTFCPVSAGHDTRKKKLMPEALFRKIIDDLKSLDYTGRLSLFSNGEPLLDPDIVERHAYARAQLPHAYLRLFTNGTLLTAEKFWGIMASLDEMIIDNYNQALELNPASKIIAEEWKAHPIPGKKVQIWLRKEDEILTSRGGDAPNRKQKIEMTTERCALPFRQIIIRPDGKVSLCCNDPLGKMTLGDLSKQSLEEIWYGEAFRDVREKLRKGRGFLEHCRFCDAYHEG